MVEIASTSHELLGQGVKIEVSPPFKALNHGPCLIEATLAMVRASKHGKPSRYLRWAASLYSPPPTTQPHTTSTPGLPAFTSSEALEEKIEQCIYTFPFQSQVPFYSLLTTVRHFIHSLPATNNQPLSPPK